jgi:hypothetical protein
LTGDRQDATVLDMNSGEIRTISLPDGDPYEFVALTISPDGHYAAFIQPDANKIDPSMGTLMIATRNTFGELGPGIAVRSEVIVPNIVDTALIGRLNFARTATLSKMRSIQSRTNQPRTAIWTSETEFIWSSDSKTLLYHWETLGNEGPNALHQQFTAIATLDGKTKQMTALPDALRVSFKGVAADGSYVLLAIVHNVTDNAGSYGQFAFLKTSNLSFHYVLSPGQNMSQIGCPIWECSSYWSPIAHRVLIGRFEADNTLSMFVIDATQPTVPIAVFRTSTTTNLFFGGWSSDGVRFATSARFDQHNAQIDVWSIERHEHITVTYKAFMIDIGEGIMLGSLRWCDKNNLLYGISLSLPETQDGIITQIANFSAATNQRRLLSPPTAYNFLHSNEFNIATPNTVMVGCTDTYTLQSGSDANGDYVRIVDGVSNRQSLLVSHKVDTQQWFGQVAVASWSGGIAWMNGDGTGQREIDLDGKIAPQMVGGNWLTFSVVHQGSDPGSAELYVANLLTGKYQKVLAESTVTPPTGYFSPDNKTLLLLDSDFTGGVSVTLDNETVGDLQVFSRQPVDFTTGVQTPSWSPDSAVVAVLTTDANSNDAAVDVYQRDGTFVRRFDQLTVSNNEQPPTLTWMPTCNP